MGIKNLKVILTQKCQHAINTRKLDSYRGMVLGIDISIFLYKYLYNNSDHIEGLTRLVLRLLKNQITPVFTYFLFHRHYKNNSYSHTIKSLRRNSRGNKKGLM